MPNPENLIGHTFDKHPERINKEGRPKKLPELDVLLAEILGEGENKKDIPGAKRIIEAMYKKALKGDVRAAELLLERAYGKTTEKVEHQFSKGIKLIFTDDDID